MILYYILSNKYVNDLYGLQVVAFVAPKIIGGKDAPSPVGELGMVEMSQALNLIDVCYDQVGDFSFKVIVKTCIYIYIFISSMNKLLKLSNA